MMKLVMALALLGATSAMANPIVQTTKSSFAVVNAGSSCLARKTAGSSIPLKDVPADHFKIAKTEFVRYQSQAPLHIELIRLTVNVPNGAPHVCELRGDSLWALHSQWYKNKEAVLPANTERFSLDCEIMCGGLKLTEKGTLISTIEVIGAEVSANGDEKPQKMENSFEVRKL